MSVAVVGGGISGLAAAWTLAATDEVVVLEAAPRVGGKLQVAPIADIPVDVGAEAMLARRPEGVGLLTELGLQPIAPLTTSAWVRAGGGLHALPARTMLGIPADTEALRASGVLSEHAVERVAAEPFLPPMPPLRSDVAVGALVRERLGNEVADRLVEPLLGGVYAGRADALSLQAAVPGVYAALGDGGSLVGAARSLLDGAPASSDPVFASLPGGLGRLPLALAESGRFEVRTGVTVRSIRRDRSGFVLDCGAVPMGYELRADRVVVATPAAKSARMLASLAPEAARDLAAIESASVAIVTFAFRDVDLPAGSGLLIGAREGLAVKGVTITSQKWPLATGGLVVLRASIGRAGDAQLLQRPDAELTALVRHELGVLLGITADPVDILVTRWGGALPQYAVGHVERVARIRAAADAVPGLAICGATFDGVGIPACIASAQAAATRLGQ
ncbi:MAG TPA: protoporphyrinogen oxidase [Jatrophihabitans sp.]|jgi:oxygen-dependent protoporphyrinogen oxidase